MSIGLVGRKCGMTRVFTEDGLAIPVSVVEATPNRITQLKTHENDGYNAIQITVGKSRKVNKPLAGHFKKANVEAGNSLWEFRYSETEKSSEKFAEKLTLGAEMKVDIFAEGQMVDVAGVTRGKGFAGTIKRHHFTMGDATHGNSLSHRSPGSIGQRQTPGRVFKGKKMSGHMGNKNRTVQSLQIVRIDQERNLLLIKGAIPGAPGGEVIVQPSVKDKTRAKE